jgi:hypothetical protein
MNEAVRANVKAVIRMMQSIDEYVLDGGYCGVRGRVVHATSTGPVRMTVKLWVNTDKPRLDDRHYEVVFSLEFGNEATETQVVDAMKTLNNFRAKSITFGADERDAVVEAINDIIGDR